MLQHTHFFECVIDVPAPDGAQRIALLQLLLRQRQLQVAVDLNALATKVSKWFQNWVYVEFNLRYFITLQQLEGFSGRDLNLLLDRAVHFQTLKSPGANELDEHSISRALVQE